MHHLHVSKIRSEQSYPHYAFKLWTDSPVVKTLASYLVVRRSPDLPDAVKYWRLLGFEREVPYSIPGSASIEFYNLISGLTSGTCFFGKYDIFKK